MHDVRDAWRALKATPVVSAAAILSLALGIGATTAIFAILDAAILRPLPVREPHRLVSIDNVPHRVWDEVRRRELFDGDFAWTWNTFNTADSGPVDPVAGLLVSGRFFDVLGVAPFAGRLLTETDDRPGAAAVAVISHALWHSRFGGAADAIGRSIVIQRAPHTIVGVMQPSFVGVNVGLPFDIAVPLAGSPELRVPFSGPRVNMMARLEPGQTPESATAALRAVQPEIREATLSPYLLPQFREGYLKEPWTATLAPGGSSVLRTPYERPLLVLLGVVGVVLAIACANIAMLLVARSTARRHELAVRVAIGASRGRLARLMLIESGMLAALGAAAGLGLAHWIAPLVVRQLSTQAYTVFLDLSLDWRVFGFTAAVGAATALLFGIAPGWHAIRAEPLDALRRERGSASDGRFGFGSVMLAGQVALSVLLITAAGLFLQTYAAFAGKDVGFERDHVLVVGVNDLRDDRQGERQRHALFERLREAASSVPGVDGAGLSLAIPAGNTVFTPRLELPGGQPLPFGMPQGVRGHHISAGWFDALGTRIVAGRDFGSGDAVTAPSVGVVNESFAQQYLDGVSAVGLTLFEIQEPLPRRLVQIVGVVQDAMYETIRTPAPPTIYFPIAQMRTALAPTVNLSIQAATGAPAALSKAIASAIGSADRDVSLTFRTLTDQVDSLFIQERILAQLSAFFGGLALVLAALGLYGLASYTVARRRMEIGIRIALGATFAAIARQVLGRVALFVAVGAAAGVALSLWASRFAASLMYGVEPGDVPTLVAAVAVLAVVCASAAWWPARRAARIDPATLLRDA